MPREHLLEGLCEQAQLQGGFITILSMHKYNQVSVPTRGHKPLHYMKLSNYRSLYGIPQYCMLLAWLHVGGGMHTGSTALSTLDVMGAGGPNTLFGLPSMNPARGLCL